MAMTVDSSSNLSPRGGGDSPQSGRKNPSSSWAQVVRVEPEPSFAANIAPSPSSTSPTPFNSEKNLASESSPKAVQLTPDNPAATSESSDSKGDNAGGRSKKQAWKKPSNGVLEVSPLGAISSWPALSESARAPSKSPAESSSKSIPDGSTSTSQGPVNPQQTAQRPAPTNSNSSSATNRTMAGTSGRYRNPRRGGSNGGNSSGGMPIQGGFTQPPPPPPPPPPFPVMSLPFIPVIPDTTIQGPQFRPNAGYISRPRMVNDHRPFPRRGNNGRGGHFNQNGSGRRDHDRGSYDNSRDVHMQSQGVQSRVPVRPPPPNFVPPFRPPFYPEFMYVPTPYGVFPYSAPPPPIFVRSPGVSPSVPAQLVHQIEYYFSDANLVGDTYLKDNMDDQGWVPISIIATFRRVSNLTNDINLMLDWLKNGSTIVEVEGDKVRRRDGWMKWIPSGQVSSDSGSLSQAGSSAENLAASLDRITMEEKDSDPRPNNS